MDAECKQCLNMHSYDHDFSKTSELKEIFASQQNIFKYEGQSQLIKKYWVDVNRYYDLVKFHSKETSKQMHKSIGLNVFSMLSSTPDYKSRYDDGVLGLAPNDPTNYYIQNNLMSQLIKFEAIDNNIFSIFSNSEPGESTHIKFGGWDQVGLQDDENLTLIRTVDRNSWGLLFNNL